MDLLKLVEFILDCERKIGNGVKFRVGVITERNLQALEFRLYWPDGYIMNLRLDFDDISQLEVHEAAVTMFIEKAKQGHPHLAPYIS